MDFKTIDITPDNILSFAPYLHEEDQSSITTPGAGGIGLLTDDGHSCGALLYKTNTDEHSVFIESLFVDEQVRKQGGGTLLLQSFDDIMKKDFDTAAARILPDASEELAIFYENAGFDDIIDGDGFFKLDSTHLKEWLTSKLGQKFSVIASRYSIHLTACDKLPSKYLGNLPDIDYDGDISFMDIDGDNGSYILAVHPNDSDLIVNRINITNTANAYGASFLYKVLSKYAKKLKNDGSLYIMAHTAEEKEMLSALFEGASQLDVQYVVKNYVEAESDPVVITNSAFLMPRINHMVKLLDDAGYSASVITTPPLGQSITLDREDGKRPINIAYKVMDDSGDAFELELSGMIVLDELTDEEKDKLKALENKPGIADISIAPDFDKAFLSTTMIESFTPTDGDAFLNVLTSFINELDNLSY